MSVNSFGLIGISFGGLIFPTLHDIDIIGGVLLFSCYSAYDTHKMIDDFENGNKDHIDHALNYSLNILNILIRIIEILAKAEENRRRYLK